MTRKEFEQLTPIFDIVIHVKHNTRYFVTDKHLKAKNPTTGEWFNAVLYSPLYENKERLFCREENSFIEEFEIEKQGGQK